MTEETLDCPFCAFTPPRGARVCRGCGAEIRYGDGGDGETAGCGCLLGFFGGLAVLDFAARHLFGRSIHAVPLWGQVLAALLGVFVSLALARWLGGANRGRDGRPRVRFARRNLNGRDEEREG